MNNKKKELIILGIVTLVLLVTLGVTYAIFTFSKTSGKSELIAGDIYMRYKETKGISLENAMPRTNYDPNGYFEFTIEGKNTYTEKDIYYDVVLDHGDALSDANRTIRIEDKYLHFRLVEVVNNEEQEIFNDKKYNNIQNKRIYVNTIPKNTTTNTSHVYRLYMWIGSEVGIGNTSSANYSASDWNKVYASVKVNVTGDFTEKYTTTPPICFTTSDNGDNTVTVTGLVKDEYEPNSNMSEEELELCSSINTFSIPYGPTCNRDCAINYCQGTSVSVLNNKNFQDNLNNGFHMSDIDYYLENNIIKIVSKPPEECQNLTEISIPSVLDGKILTTIGANAFSVNQLTSVEIPNSVTAIGNAAFNGNQLTSIEIPNSVTLIGDSAFYKNQLTSVEIPNSVTTIGFAAFSENQLTSVDIPNSVTAIGERAFSVNQLTSVSIGNSVTTIGDFAFTNNQLTSVDIPNSVTTIGWSAFSNNPLTSVSIGNGITSIGKTAFIKQTNSNPNFSSITIDKSCNDIKNNLLSNSTNYYPWLSTNSPYTAPGVTIYGSNNEVCDSFN